jgi:magnesium transporter
MVRAAELAESYRDAMTSLLDAYLSMTSNRMNEIMKVLTMFSTFFLPLTFIAGLYGMNFDPNASPYNMPELRWFYGYPFALVLMLVIGIAMYIYFRKKKWM